MKTQDEQTQDTRPEKRVRMLGKKRDVVDAVDRVERTGGNGARCVIMHGEDPYTHVHELVRMLRGVMQKEMATPVLRDETTLQLMQVLTTLNKEVYGV